MQLKYFNLNTEAGKLALKTLLDTAPNSVKIFIEFDSNKYLFVGNTLADVLNEDNYHGFDVNIAIASTITAGARIFMSAFKNNPLYNLFYSDTDSIVIDRLLNARLVGAALGLLKLEHTITRAVFLARKVYVSVAVIKPSILLKIDCPTSAWGQSQRPLANVSLQMSHPRQ
jgi:hypothetical protein